MKVNIGYRVTVNIGNYESVQYNIGVEVETDIKKLDGIRKTLEEYLESEIVEKVKEIKTNGREKFGFDTNKDEEVIDYLSN